MPNRPVDPTRPPDPTRREEAYWWLRRALPPRGDENVGLGGVAVVLAGLVLLLSAVAVAVGEAGTIPTIIGIAGMVFGLFVAYRIFGGL